MKKKLLSLLLALAMCLALSVPAFAVDSRVEYYPLWMKPNSIIIYDADSDKEIVQGGKLTSEEIAAQPEILRLGLTTNALDMIVSPSTKVVYDQHGFIQNIYYKVPGTDDSYQLKNPNASRAGTGILYKNSSVSYGNYIDYDDSSRPTKRNLLERTTSMIVGTGRITFYSSSNVHGENPNHNLEYYDCATKMEYCDVEGGTRVFARSLASNRSRYFNKWDCGGLPAAILDIWSDSNYNPITELTPGGVVDNVYQGYISLSVDPSIP